MNITVLPADQLTAEHAAVWSRLQREDAALESPYFRPEFTQAIAKVRPGVEVAILEDRREPVGFFAFERTCQNIALPVAGLLADYQGIVVRKGLSWDAEELIRGCGLKAWTFNHLVASQQPFHPYHYMSAESPYIDLSRGFDAYHAKLRKRGSRTIQQILRKTRKIQREIGPLRFEPHTTDKRVMQKLFDWKSEQCRRTKVTDPFEFRWTKAFVENSLAEGTEEFSTMLSALYIGDQLTAIHFGLRSYGVLHGLSHTYSLNFSKYSPGIILTIHLAQNAQSLGLRRLDLGKGPEEYKKRLRSGATPLAVGSVDLRPVAARARRASFGLRQSVLNSPLYRPARATARAGARIFPPLRGWLALRQT